MSEIENDNENVNLNSSVDSGVCVEVVDTANQNKKLLEYKRILFILLRDQTLRQEQREKLCKVVEKKPKPPCTTADSTCNVCFSELNTEDIQRCVSCCNCKKSVCRGEKCSVWIPKEAGWECKLCNLSDESRAKANEWLEKQIFTDSNSIELSEKFIYPTVNKSEQFRQLRERHSSPDLYNYEIQSEAPSSLCIDQKTQIREYVEDILSHMLGGSLDSISVGQMSRSESYIKLFHKYHTNLSQNLFMLENSIRLSLFEDLPQSGTENELTGISHSKLRRLIERILADTLRLPSLVDQQKEQEENKIPNGQCHDGETNNDLHYFDANKYQELLATAVLNKIVEKNFQSPRDSAIDKNHNTVSGKDRSYSSESSIEPRSESSYTDPTLSFSKQEDDQSPSESLSLFTDALNENIDADRESILSGYLASHRVPLPDFSADSESASEEFQSLMFNGSESTWEDNWLFKKKKLGQESASVGMLVPAPREDVRALIGDRTADEVSDSDLEDSSLDTQRDEDPPHERVRNAHLIGGKNTAGLFDTMADPTSMVSTSSSQEDDTAFTETKNDFVISKDGLSETESGKISVNSCGVPIGNQAVNTEVTFNILQCSPPKADGLEGDSLEETILAPPNEFGDIRSAAEEQSPSSPVSDVGAGSIAEREHKKWKNAVDMPNNPYSPEALKRRLSGSEEKFIDLPNIDPTRNEQLSSLLPGKLSDEEKDEDYTRYSRDYYINDSKPPGASRKKIPIVDIPPGESDGAMKEVTRRRFDFYNYGISSNIVPRSHSLKSLRPKSYSAIEDDVESHHSWKSSSKRSDILSQFEKQLLHKNLRRDSFRARSTTTKEFVFNPLFDAELEGSIGMKKEEPVLENGDTTDSGVDSFINGFTANTREGVRNKLIGE